MSANPTLLIPKGYQRIAETFEQYEKVTVTMYKNPDTQKFLMKSIDHISEEEKLHGPYDIRQLKVILHVITDSLWKEGVHK